MSKFRESSAKGCLATPSVARNAQLTGTSAYCRGSNCNLGSLPAPANILANATQIIWHCVSRYLSHGGRPAIRPPKDTKSVPPLQHAHFAVKRAVPPWFRAAAGAVFPRYPPLPSASPPGLSVVEKPVLSTAKPLRSFHAPILALKRSPPSSEFATKV